MSQTSVFDPEAFASQTVNAAMDTELIPVPVGEYVAQITSFKLRQSPRKDGQGMVTAMDLTCEIDSARHPEVLTTIKRDKATVRHGILLDITPQNTLDEAKGKNIGLGRIREAVGQNQAGQPWAPNMLVGQMLRVHVAHTMTNGKPYAEAKEVSAL